MIENWKDIEGYKGAYMVSDQGNVKSMNYNGTGKERLLKPYQKEKGYKSVCLYIGRKKYMRRVHVLVAQAFLNHVPCGYKLVVDHIDENPKNNNLSNLQIITNRENIARSIDKTKTSSQYRNVYWSKSNNKWQALVQSNRKRYHLGYFTDEVKANETVIKFKEDNNIS